jgi:hypothetical protein
MKKQELIEKYEYELKLLRLQFGEILRTKVYEELLDYLKQLDEPQKLVVPQFVADWYEENKDDFETALFHSIDLMPSTYKEGELSEFEEWLADEHTKPFQTLVNMHQFGYEVEKEKRYRVSVKNLRTRQGTLNRSKKSGVFIFSNPEENNLYGTKFTRKELENAGFGWVFDCSGVEVEEVEDDSKV